ncbi:MAG: hypothetical protein WA888_19955 [Burkholderiaceae bacterium]
MSRRLRNQLLWFAALWIAGILSLTVVAGLIRLALFGWQAA